MKKNIILIMLLIICINAAAELDYSLLSEFGFGGVGFVLYSNEKIFSTNSYGYTIYEIQGNGTLQSVGNVRYSPHINPHYSHDKLAVYSGLMNFSKREDYGSYFTIYDTSVPNEQTILYHTQIDIDNMFSAELFEDYFIRKTGNHQYTVYDYQTFQPVSQVDNISLIYNTKFNDQGAVLLDYSDNFYYYYEIDDEGILHKKFNLGETERKVSIDGNKLISYTRGDINFYSITDSDELELLGSFFLPEPILYRSQIAFKNDMIAFSIAEGTYPRTSRLYLYDATDVSSIHSIELLDSVDLSNRPFTQFREAASLVQSDDDLYVYTSEFLLHASINNGNIILDDIGIPEIGSLSTQGVIKNDLFYTQHIYRDCNLKMFSLADLTNVQDVAHDYPDASLYRFLEENEKAIRYDELTGAVSLYDFSGDEMVLEATYAPQPPFPQDWFDVLKWDGTHFIYTSLGSLYSVVYRDGEFIQTWSISNSDYYFYNYSYGIYENYLYEYKKGIGVFVHEFTEDSSNQINYITIPFTRGKDAYFQGDIVNIDNKIVDLSVDPINLSQRYNLNQYCVYGCPKSYNDYLFYCGKENVYENGTLVAIDEGIFIYKFIDDTPSKVGAIVTGNYISNVQVIPGRTEDSFNLLVHESNYFSIYSCQATPNGDLEITPVTLNATNYPNPFNPETTISYDVAQKGSVTVDIYNLKGQKVKSLLNENQEAGKHSIIWQGDNDQGKQVSSGTYFYRIKNAGHEVVKKMLLMK
ncbi:MAG: T9SS type A sorting domain-containing protein [Candidatus Cloacimonadales bacterium]